MSEKENIEELKKKYDQLNDFSNSQLKKVLIENETLKKRETAFYNKIEEMEKENEKLKAANKELLLKVEALRLERDLYIESRR